MRHFLVPRPFAAPVPIAPLALGMAVPTAARLLITPPRGAQRLASRQGAAARSAVLLTAVAARADENLASAPGTYEQPGIVHRSSRRGGLDDPRSSGNTDLGAVRQCGPGRSLGRGPPSLYGPGLRRPLRRVRSNCNSATPSSPENHTTVSLARQHRFRRETTSVLGPATRAICPRNQGTTLAENDRTRAVPDRHPEVHNYPPGVTSTPVFGKDLLRADAYAPDRFTHTDQAPFAEYARFYVAVNKPSPHARWWRGESEAAPSAGSFERDVADDVLEQANGREVLGRAPRDEPGAAATSPESERQRLQIERGEPSEEGERNPGQPRPLGEKEEALGAGVEHRSGALAGAFAQPLENRCERGDASAGT